MNISASMIVKNEQMCLERCLRSIKGVDEIVILDTGSTDGTGKIAQRYTDRYYPDEYKWNDNFAEARNLALAKCTGDWILSIDADEWLEEGGIERIRAAIAETDKKSINFHLISSNGEMVHYAPRLHKNQKDIFWKGRVHNYLNINEQNNTDITITYGQSPTHRIDPDRALRILQLVVNENPDSMREVYYLGREYSEKSDWIKAVYWLNIYVSKSPPSDELAEVYLLMARCYFQLRQKNKARYACLRAIAINTHFEEAIRVMATMSGPRNEARWLEFATGATNENVLFNRSVKVQPPGYYDNLYRTMDFTVHRYDALREKVGELARGKVLDIGCGTAPLQEYIKDYHGFDFSPEAVKLAKNPNVWPGNVYDRANYGGDYDTYIAIEVLEHLKNDCKVLEYIPKGRRIILSVPSFPDKTHVRTFTKSILETRYKDFIEIKQIIRFNLKANAFVLARDESVPDYILLVEAVRK